MRTARFLLALFGAAAIQAVGVHTIGSFFMVIDLFLVLAVFNALESGPAGSMLGGSVAGLAQDALSGGFFGLHGFVDTLVAWAVMKVRQRLVIQQAGQVGLLFALAAAFQLTLLALLQYSMLPGSRLPDVLTMAVRMVATGTAGILLSIFSERAGRRLDAWREQRRRRLRLEVD